MFTFEDLIRINSAGIQQLKALGSEKLDLSTMFTGNPQVAAKFDVIRTVEEDSTRPDVNKIKLAVTWKSYDGRSHNRTMSTIYSKHGLYDYYYTTAAP